MIQFLDFFDNIQNNLYSFKKYNFILKIEYKFLINNFYKNNVNWTYWKKIIWKRYFW